MILNRQHIESATIYLFVEGIHKARIAVITICLFTLVSSTTFSQSIPQSINTYAEQIRTAQHAEVPNSLREKKNALEVIEESTKYFDDSLSRVRAKMYMLVAEVGRNATDAQTRQKAVGKLMTATKDHQNLDLLLTELKRFNRESFLSSSKDTLVFLFRQSPPYFDQLIRLIGSLQLAELSDELRLVSGPTTKNQTVRWAALLALARMNDPDAMQSVMKKVQRLPVNDDVVYEIFPDLIYTQQRQAIDYLLVELNSDEKKCFTADAEDETPITCAYRIMEMLAPVIEKYPLELDASGDIKTKDYKKSLATVRTWFMKNTNYKIVQ